MPCAVSQHRTQRQIHQRDVPVGDHGSCRVAHGVPLVSRGSWMAPPTHSSALPPAWPTTPPLGASRNTLSLKLSAQQNGVQNSATVTGQAGVPVALLAGRHGPLHVRMSGRRDNWHGPCQQLKGRLKPMTTYAVTAWVRVAEGRVVGLNRGLQGPRGTPRRQPVPVCQRLVGQLRDCRSFLEGMGAVLGLVAGWRGPLSRPLSTPRAPGHASTFCLRMCAWRRWTGAPGFPELRA